MPDRRVLAVPTGVLRVATENTLDALYHWTSSLENMQARMNLGSPICCRNL